ncbi:hypothetical protein DFH05DRAFT_1002555 [Lentinula detonsa]|uniref:Uncharacterized protein n=1 Tax=Lentinula detonsa TaxID=2804962 RepID=A0A9W8P1Y0_9AGAR|nr:hypothetical protein DFH05DRAFT_1002555 [Lentinula detonsa]
MYLFLVLHISSIPIVFTIPFITHCLFLRFVSLLLTCCCHTFSVFFSSTYGCTSYSYATYTCILLLVVLILPVC